MNHLYLPASEPGTETWGRNWDYPIAQFSEGQDGAHILLQGAVGSHCS